MHRDDNRLSRQLTIPLLVACLAPALSTAARGDVPIAEFDGEGDYSYAVNFMTDLDQRRDGLGNDGSMFCVPTSAMNLLAYAANFGFPGSAPEPGLWEGMSGHDTMTGYIGLLGTPLFMDTDPVDGTSGSSIYDGFNLWLDASGMPLTVIRYLRAGDFWPSIDVGTFVATNGAVVNFCFGRYLWDDGGGIPSLTERKGGHCVTLQRSVATNGSLLGPREIRIRNPSSPNDGNLNSNSAYSSQDLVTAANIQVERNGTDYVVTSLLNPPPADDTRLRIIDSFTALFPPGGLTYTSVQVNAQFANGGLGFVQDQLPVPFDVNPDATIVSVAPHPELHSALAVVRNTEGREQLLQLPHRDGRIASLMELPGDTEQLVPAAGHFTYAVSRSHITVLKTTAVLAEVSGAVRLPPDAAAARTLSAAHDDSSGLLFILLTFERDSHLLLYDPTLFPVAAFRVTGRFAGEDVQSLAVSRDGLVAAFKNGQVAGSDLPMAPRKLRGRPTVGFKRLKLDGVEHALSVDVDHFGRLYVGDRTGLLEFEQNDRKWEPVRNPLYGDFDLAGRRFVVFRSRTNTDDRLHATPEWNNIVPEDLYPLGPDLQD